MRYGIALPSLRDGATAEGIAAAAETAERLGWDSVWTTDHVLVETDSAEEYGTIFDVITTLAWVGARHSRIRLGTSVIVVPMRNAVVLAKELATLDALTGGRVIAGVGVGWDRAEFGNLGVADRFRVRGAYLDETIRLWRHLWSGAPPPFEGRFHPLDDYVFGPLPAQGGGLPIWIGGRSEPALRRAGRLADGYHSSQAGPAQWAERLPIVRAAAEAAGRPMPTLSARVRVRFGDPPASGYALAGGPEAMRHDVAAFARLGVELLVLVFDETDPGRVVAAMERFDEEVVRSAAEGQ
ncbi:MAG TPA: TIGR03619 family F420-dependent LLM class oxidoreductase [Candidatus Limnocylindrales bacterium]|nr:TIGR03619 family F420-dependent LLM class oxidoreductase [Candidatus Limnocylindrales bacterium]